MKKTFAIIICLCMIVGMMSGCGVITTEEIRDVSAREVLSNIWRAAPIEGKLLCYISGTNEATDFFEDLGMDEDTRALIEDVAIVRSFEARSDMYIILKSKDIKSITAVLESYRNSRIADFAGYAPKEEAKLKASEIIAKGSFVALLVNEDYQLVKDAFNEVLSTDFSGSYKENQESTQFLVDAAESTKNIGCYDPDYIEVPETEEPATEDSGSEEFAEGSGRMQLEDGTVLIEEVDGVIEPYDTSHIVKAYNTGNTDGLNERDLEVLAKAKEIIDDYISDDMSMLEKEKSIHNYLTQNASYDENCLIYSTWYTEYADQPYGCLIMKQAICLGYTTTFKMLMDMLDIECLIVPGQANAEQANHAWNMVRLDDGCWYTVDVTWDDPVGGEGLYYTFFNTTDEFMEETLHFWDRDSYPAATGGKYADIFYDE